MTYRYIYRALTVVQPEGATEFWMGLETPEPLDLDHYAEFIPADGMTEDELSIVQRWITVD